MNKRFIFIQICLLYFWISFLKDTDSIYSVYAFCAGAALLALWSNVKVKRPVSPNTTQNKEIVISAVFFACCITLANWAAFIKSGEKYLGLVSDKIVFLYICMEAALVFAGSVIVYWNIAQYICQNIQKIAAICAGVGDEPEKRHCRLIRFALLTTPCLLVLVLFDYPGTLTKDSIVQLNQIYSGIYTNHHPFYHTMLIKTFLSIGMKLFNDINMSVALYSVFQIIVGASCFSFVLSTMEKAGIKRQSRILYILWFILLPYNIIFSMTMWKDVIYSYAAIVLITAIYRLFKGLGDTNINYFILGISGLIFCLYRSNGLFAFLVLLVTYIVFFHEKENYCTIIIMSLVVIMAIVLKYPVLDALNVPQPRTAEGLSIPEQQIARVIANGNYLTEEEEKLVNKVIDIEEVDNLYEPNLSDPIKFAIDDDYLTKHKDEYFALWLNLGKRYPLDYIIAWIEQTKGYWNGCYDSPPYTYGVFENNYGITNVQLSGIYLLYMQLFRLPFMGPFLGIGFHFWILVLCSTLCAVWKKWEELFLTVPLYGIWLSLIIATPDYCSMRYFYPLFICLPFIIVVSSIAIINEA